LILSRGDRRLGVGCALDHLVCPDGQAAIFVCADNLHGRTRGITGFSTARERFEPFALAWVLEEGITPSFGNNWQATDIAGGPFDHFFQMRLEIVI
jgi:hypothetical protein